MYKILKVIGLIWCGCLVGCVGCQKESMECGQHLPSIVGEVTAIGNEEIDVFITQDTDEVDKNETISLRFEEKAALETRVKELGLVQGSTIRVLYYEINEVNGEREIDIDFPGSIMLFQ